jgi:hypothetical protein
MGDFFAGFRRLIGFISVLSAVLTVVAIFQPNTRAWLLSHAPVGWALALLSAATVSFLVGLLVSVQKSVRSLATAAGVSDQLLLNERLMGWNQGDMIMEWLAYHFYADQVPSDLNKQMEVRGKAWGLDERRFASTSLQSAFEELHASVDAFFDVSVDELWFGQETHYDYLEMRVRKGHPDYDEVTASLVGAAGRLLAALQAIFKIAQEERIVIE